MNGTLCRMLLTVAVSGCTIADAATFTVAKNGSGNYSSIQAAVDAASSKDEIIVLDNALYEEQVTIDSARNGLVLRAADPLSKSKPVIRYNDNMNVHPKTFAESRDSSKITYCRNGALRIIGATGVTIEGVTVDGGGAVPFAYPAVWQGITPLFHGNAALVLSLAGEAIIRESEFRNAYYGIYCYEHNEGGINAEAGALDTDTRNIVPGAAFSTSGNNLFEHNRIHDNTWGMYFESLWDMGSTVRYNLIYNNHHASDAAAAHAAALPGGKDQAGGALLFKDVRFSPVAVYNNTFLHNYLNFAHLAGANAHHLIFNNIFGAPFRLWSADPAFPNPSCAFDQSFVNRMFNCVYSHQAENPETTTVRILDSILDAGSGAYVRIDTTITAIGRMRIMAGMEQLKSGMELALTVHLSSKDTIITRTIEKVFEPGSPITAETSLKPFPESADVRWLECPFLSIDPENDNFLVPDWNNPLVKKYIIDKGWNESGISDPDGLPADIGAIAQGSSRPAELVTIRQIAPVEIIQGTARLSFSAAQRSAGPNSEDLQITYLNLVTNLDKSATAGTTSEAIQAGNIYTIALPATKIIQGSNHIEILLPTLNIGSFAFFEMVLQGTAANGKKYYSTVGFLPIRQLDYQLDVALFDTATRQPVTDAVAGVPYILHAIAYQGKAMFPNLINPAEVSLQSRFDLNSPEGKVVSSIPGGINGTAETMIIFTHVPYGGVDYIHLSGSWTKDNMTIAFLGTSQGITVHPGLVEHLQFTIPPEDRAVIHPGTAKLLTVQLSDKFGNPAQAGLKITCSSLNPEIGRVTSGEAATDSTGCALFNTVITNGNTGAQFPIVATYTPSNASDTILLEVGVAAGSAVVHPASIVSRSHPILCELIDLRGKVLRRETVDSHRLLQGTLPFSSMTSRGMYIVKTKDLESGTVKREQRLLLTR